MGVETDLTPTSVEEVITQMLAYSMHDDAEQLADCLNAQYQAKNESALYHLLLTYKRRPHSIIRICREAAVTSARCQLMLAAAYYELREYSQVETVLLGNAILSLLGTDQEGIVQTVKNRFATRDSCAYALTLMAKVCRNTNRPDLATLLARHALAINPFLFSAMSVFAVTASSREINDLSQEVSEYDCTLTENTLVYTPQSSELQNTAVQSNISTPTRSDNLQMTQMETNVDELTTPAAYAKTRARESTRGHEAGLEVAAPLRSRVANQQQANSAATRRAIRRSGTDDTENTSEKPLGVRLRKTRSRTKDTEQTSVVKESVKEDRSMPDTHGTLSTEAIATSEKVEESTTSAIRKKSSRSHQALLRLRSMCKSLFAAIAAQHRCNGERVFNALETIRQRLQYTPPVLICRARVYYDSGDYVEAAKVYETLLKQFSWSTRGMEHYSTTLWHLHRPHELSRLCLLMEQCYRYAPETWVSIANAFSLEKQHDRAIRALRRAIDLNPSLAFAYVLLGHEYMAVGKHQEASDAFYEAKKLDATMWNAWYGLGLLKFKDEDLHVAAIYFSYAMRINNSNPTIMVHNAVTLARLGNINSARRLYMRALAICPTHVMGRYHLAQLHYYLKDFRNCIALCEELLEECPREANIYVLMGKCYSNLKDMPRALLNYTLANDLQPRPDLQMYLLAPFRDDVGLMVVANDTSRVNNGSSEAHESTHRTLDGTTEEADAIEQ